MLGCGGIGDVHCAAYRDRPDVEIVAVADIDAANLDRVALKYGVPGRFTDYRDLLRETTPEIVSVCTWPGLHAEMTIAAAQAGALGILCEKPLARSLGEVDRMIAACRASGSKLATGHQHRFNPVHSLARERVAGGAIGAPVLLRCRTNRGLMNNGSHGIDLMRFLLGDPTAEWVVGQTGRSIDRWERGGRIEEFGTGIIGFLNDVQAILTTDLPGEAEFYPMVVGDRGVMHLMGDSLRIVGPSGESIEKPERTRGDYAAEVAELVDWIDGGHAHRSAAEHGRAAIEIVMALYESARTHSRIDLPFTAADSPLERMIDDGVLTPVSAGRVEI